MLYPIELGVHRFFRASQVHLPSQIQERPERTMNTASLLSGSSHLSLPGSS